MIHHRLRIAAWSVLSLACLVVPAAAQSALAQDAAAKGTDVYGDPLPAGAIARLGSVRFHHPTGLVALAFAPDGTTILAVGHGAKGMSLRFWATATGKEVAQFDLDNGPYTGPYAHNLRQVQFAPDGKTVALCRMKGVELVDRTSGKIVQTFGKTDVFSCAFSPDGKLLAGGSMEYQENNPIRVWEVATGRELAPFPGRGASVNAVTFSADGKRLLSGPTAGRFIMAGKKDALPSIICVWDVETRKKVHEIIPPNSNVAFAPDGERIAYEQDGIRLVAATTGKELGRIEIKNASFAFAPDSKRLVSLDAAEGLRLWDVTALKESRRLAGALGQQGRLAGFSPDGKLLAVMDGAWNQDGVVRLWDVATGTEVRPFGGHHDIINHVAYAPGGKLLASASNDGTARLWDPASGKEVRRLDGHGAAVFAVAFTPDGKMLASTSADGTTRLWDVATGAQRVAFKNPPGRDVPAIGGPLPYSGAALAFTPDGKTLIAVGKNRMLAVWDVIAKKQIRHAVLDEQGLSSLTIPAISPSRQTVLAANEGDWGLFDDAQAPERLRLWNTATGEPLLSMPLREARPGSTHIVCVGVAASPDGAMFASSQLLETHGLRRILSDPSLRLWERLTGKEYLLIKGTLGQALAFSPDGRLLAADDGTVEAMGFGMRKFGARINLWDTWTGERHIQLPGHAAAVRCLAFAPDGKTLASGGVDHTILVWNTPPRKQPAPGSADAKELRAWWDDLARVDAAAAIQASAKLTLNPEGAARLIREHLKPVPPVDRKQIAALVRDLDSVEFEVRDRAQRLLEELEERAEPDLRQALAGAPSVEVQRRLELLLKRAARVPAKQLQALRAVAVLERIDNGESRSVLDALARGAAGSRITVEATAALARVAR